MSPRPAAPDQPASRPSDRDTAREPRSVQPGPAPAGGRRSAHHRGLTEEALTDAAESWNVRDCHRGRG